MKKALLFLLLFPVCIFAQQREVFHIDSLPKEGILLNRGWKWHAGDNAEWAKPEFDDAKWADIDPTKDIFELPQLSKSGEIGWFRIRIKVNKSIQEQFLFILHKSGASEMYMDGKLIHRYGTLSHNLKAIKAISPIANITPINLPNDSIAVIAFRYCLQPHILYSRLLAGNNVAIQFVVYPTFHDLGKYFPISRIGIQYSIIFRIGAFLILASIFLSLYFFYPQQKTNLFFFMYTITELIFDVGQFVFFSMNQIQVRYYLINIGLDAHQVGSFFLLTALYLLMNQKRGGYYWVLMTLIILGLIINASLYQYADLVTVVGISNLINFEIIRITFKSLKTRRNGALIITIGGISFALFWGVFIFSFIFNFLTIPFLGTIFTLGDLAYNLSQLSIPIAVCIYFGLDIALTNKALGQKLIEVETLSDEKQTILAAQNETLEQQVKERTAELNKSLETLKSTQAQLIQSEKLASLGELTAGIAHEIQNPLNFVNNFAEVSAELLDDMKADLQAGKTAEAAEIADDLQVNLQKINHHGQRASAIVKGMLEHSRTSTGMKVATDLNALADEYLRLAYHGLRAKDSSFNATMETHFDPDLPKIEVIPQDIGRVLLNLINNAFYAVHQRNNAVETLHAMSLPYQPTVTITTRKLENAIEITVKDNGNGIPDTIKDKIFQPFFTTKPTGQGTGLGLSLAYDIVTKGHRGTLEVVSKISAGTEFIIHLPY
jgi:signal transduction histidine kinase